MRFRIDVILPEVEKPKEEKHKIEEKCELCGEIHGVDDPCEKGLISKEPLEDLVNHDHTRLLKSLRKDKKKSKRKSK